MTNVHGIAVDAAAAIVERLTGWRRRAARSRRASPTCSSAEDSDARYEAEFWVAVAFVIFVGVLIYFGVHTDRSSSALDQRAARIKCRARRGAPPQGGGAGAAGRVSAQAAARPSARLPQIIAGARAEAERLAAEAKTKVEEFVARRTKMAETKIAQAEAQALADVRAAAADAAVAAAEKILTQSVKGKRRR